MADKVFNLTATDVEIIKVRADAVGNVFDSDGSAIITISAPYRFVNSEGDPLTEVKDKDIILSNNMASLSSEVQGAVQTILAYIRDEVLTLEGMND